MKVTHGSRIIDPSTGLTKLDLVRYYAQAASWALPHLNGRAAYIRRYFGQDWTDRRLYHMMINSCMGFEAMVQSTVDGAGLARLRITEPATQL